MLKKRIFFVSLILMSTLFSPVFAQDADTLAVLDFTTEAVSEIEMSAIVEFLSAELFKTKKYTVIDVSQRETILKEMEFSMQGCSDDSCALEIGKMLSAELIVTGNLSKVGSRYLMSVKMLETETSRTMGTANGKYTDLDELIDGLEPIAFSLAGMEDEVKTTVAVETKPEAEAVLEKSEPVKETAPVVSESTDKVGTTATEPQSSSSGKAESGGGSSLPAIICTATGIAGIGTGGYFLYKLFSDSLPAYNAAKDAYDLAYGDEADYTGLYNASVNAYDDAFLDFVIGAGTAGLGIILTTVGIILFPPAENDGAAVSLMPVISDNPGMVVRVSY